MCTIMKRQNQSLQYLEQGKNVLRFVMANCNIDIPSEKVHIFNPSNLHSDQITSNLFNSIHLYRGCRLEINIIIQINTL